MRGRLIQKKSDFTLIELMIVISVIAVIAGVVGINALQLLREQRFSSGVDAVWEKLQLAQSIMLIENNEVTVIIEKLPDDTLKCRIKTNTEIKSRLKTATELGREIKGIRHVTFEEEGLNKMEDRVLLKFSSIHMQTPKGTLILYGPGTLKKKLFLPGYPSPMGSATEKSVYEISAHENEFLYPKEVLEDCQQKQAKNSEKKLSSS